MNRRQVAIVALRRRHVRRTYKLRHPGCQHAAWKRLDDQFAECTSCKLLKAYRLGDPPKLDRLPAILQGRRPPPASRKGDGYDIVLGGRLKLHQLCFRNGSERDLYTLAVRFPKGWAETMCFHPLNWSEVLATYRKVKRASPLKIYKALQLAIYGRYHMSAVERLL
jgi:hypothetical protein